MNKIYKVAYNKIYNWPDLSLPSYTKWLKINEAHTLGIMTSIITVILCGKPYINHNLEKDKLLIENKLSTKLDKSIAKTVNIVSTLIPLSCTGYSMGYFFSRYGITKVYGGTATMFIIICGANFIKK